MMADSSTQAYADRSRDHTALPLVGRPSAWVIALARLRAPIVALAFALASGLALPAGVLFASPPAAASGETPPQAPELETPVVVRGSIDAPLASIRAVLLDLERFYRWFPRLAEWEVLSREAGSALVYGRQALPWPIADRDYVVRYRWRDAAGGAFLLEAVSVASAQALPRRGVVRIERLRSEWHLRAAASGGRTEASYEYAGGLGGSIPGWVARIDWRSRSTAVIDALAEEVARRAAER